MSWSKHSSLMSRSASKGSHVSKEGPRASLAELLYARDCGILGDTRRQEGFLSRKERYKRQQARECEHMECME